jgi:hypothetical protein
MKTHMHKPIQLKTLAAKTSISRSPLRCGLFFVALALAHFALSSRTQAVNPPPDGGYPGGNTAEGTNALFSLTTGIWNTALGFEALRNDTLGRFNTATGIRALFSDTSGSNNTANGVYALFSNATGWYNSATGAYALSHNTTGSNNTANGYGALYRNSTGFLNTAVGFLALQNNTGITVGFEASNNTAVGVFALQHNTTGAANTATGANALSENTTADGNTANGSSALRLNTTGEDNTANGSAALFFNTTGRSNTANGFQALSSNTTGDGNIALGDHAGVNLTTGDNNIDIGNEGVADESNTIRIGSSLDQTRTLIAGIRDVTTATAAIPVVISTEGQLGTMSSSRRFKDEIKPMDKTSETILALKPVTFHYKSDRVGTPQFGLIAEEVAEVNPDLVVRDAKGEVYTVRYDAVNAMLLNEFLKEHRKVQELEAGMKVLAARLEKQEAQIQKVGAQLEVMKPAPQTVLNDQ